MMKMGDDSCVLDEGGRFRFYVEYLEYESSWDKLVPVIKKCIEHDIYVSDWGNHLHNVMNKLLILQGIPASGKSFFAKQWAEESPKTRVIVSRDSIRRGLGVYWVPSREALVSEIEMSMVEIALMNDYDVCLDSTNLNPTFLQRWEDLNPYIEFEIEYKQFEISLEEALERDKNREFSVGEEVVKSFYNKYKK